jgi:SulP family sulfate permease
VLLGMRQDILVAIVVALLSLAYQVAELPVYMLRRKRGTNVFRSVSDERP